MMGGTYLVPFLTKSKLIFHFFIFMMSSILYYLVDLFFNSNDVIKCSCYLINQGLVITHVVLISEIKILIILNYP